MPPKSFTIYEIIMPDGNKYWLTGWGKKKIDEKYGVPEKNVRLGADTMKTPNISAYF